MMSFMEGYPKKKGMGAGMSLVLGIGIGSFIGAAVGTFIAHKNNFVGGFNMNDLRNQRYEFGRESGISGTPSGFFKTNNSSKSKITYGHGLNYGVSGFGSGLNNSQTNFNSEK